MSTIRYVKYEEPDEYQVLEQGSVIGLGNARTANFGRKAKIYGDGTQTFDGRSEIQRQVLRGDPYVDMLQRVGQHPASQVALLTPRLWEQHFAANPLRSDLHIHP